MGIYLDYKKTEKDVIESGKLHALQYFTEKYMPFVDNLISSYKYHHCDLTKEETNELFDMNKINREGTMLSGGDVYEVIGDTLVKTREIDLFVILNQIQHIVNKRKSEKPR